jgi:DNA-binding XRE family transcriptional regulator
MLEPMEKCPTAETVELCFVGPASLAEEAKVRLRTMGFKECIQGDGTPWRDILPHAPGDMLAGARYRESMTQVQLAEATGIPRRHISEMENNKRPIGKANARKLAQALRMDYRRFL